MLLPGLARGGTIFTASLDGTQEVPPNPSPGTGMGVVDLNNAMDSISVTLDWQDLLAGATSATINEAPPGSTGPIIFSLALGSGAGTTSGSIDPSPQVFSITPAEVTALQAGDLYVEVATSQFPAGEIRGQLSAVPEPSTLVPAAIAGLAGLGALWHRRRRNNVAP
jgi:MYXO-CTERM domain-containing protein